MNQIPPGEGQGVDETGIHDQAAEIGDLGGGDVSCQGEEQIQAAEHIVAWVLSIRSLRQGFLETSALS